MDKATADKLDITKQEEPAKVRKPMKPHPATLVKKNVVYTEFADEDNKNKVYYEAVYYFPMIYRVKRDKMIIPEAKNKQKEDFVKEAEIHLNRRVKRIIKKQL